MSWLSVLSQTYEKAMKSGTALDDSLHPLLPISHTTQMAEIEITIDSEGNFLDARVIENKKERQTLIPCTEDSAARSGPGAKLRPHPLHDKLQYVAGDYFRYGGSKGSEGHENYLKQLRMWNESMFGSDVTRAVLTYVEKGNVVCDLVSSGKLFLDENGHYLESWSREGEKPAIYSAVAGNISDAFVRFRILEDDDLNIIEPWNDEKIIQSFLAFYESMQEESGLDYVTGQTLPLTKLHPKKIRNTGDSAKLISANDSSGFTYRGRVNEASETSQVSYRVSQQGHNALKWLIEKQGIKFGDRVFLVWGTSGEIVPSPVDNTLAIVESEESHTPIGGENIVTSPNEGEKENTQKYITEEIFVAQFRKSLHGYAAKLGRDSNLAIIVLDAATPGRMAVTFYRYYPSDETAKYFDNIELWHDLLAWRNLSYSKKNQKTISYLGSPSLKDIALVAYGVQRGEFLELDDKIIAQVTSRLLPCVLEPSLRIPSNIVRAAYLNACFPQKYSEFNWSKVRGVACSLIKAERQQKYKEKWSVEVDMETKDLNYNIGRLVAVLDEIEGRALRAGSSDGKKNRATSVERYFSKIAEHPNRTFETIMKQLQPYRIRLGVKGTDLYKVEQEIAASINPDEFAKAKNLDGRFLLGFDAQKHEFYKKFKPKNGDAAPSETDNDSDIE